MIRVSPADFDRAVAQALAEIPPEFQPYLENVTIEVQPRPTRRFQREHDVPADLLGIYVGVPLDQKGPEMAPSPLPDRIVIFSENLCEMCATWDELVQEIRVTVLHEVGHHFGLDEDRLSALGYD